MFFYNYIEKKVSSPKTDLDYYPFGKVLRSFNGNNKYQFTGKEYDAETNLTDFGARKYDADIGRWLSVDKLKDTYPSMTPYNYSANNPVFYKDPDGNVVTPYNEESKKLYDAFRANIFNDKNNVQMQKVIERLESSDITYQIMYTTGKKNEGTINWATPEVEGSAGHVVNVNIMVSPSQDEQTMNTYAINILGDEIIGAHQFDTGDLGFVQTNDGKTGTTGYDKWDEISTKIGSIKAAKSNSVDRVGSAQVFEDKVINAKKWSPEQFIDKYTSKTGDSYKNYITGLGMTQVLMGYMMQMNGIDVHTAKDNKEIKNFIYRRGNKNNTDGTIQYKTVTGN